SVTVNGATVGAIRRGLLLLVGIEVGDDAALVRRMALKCAAVRIFPGEDDHSHFDRSLLDVGGEALVVSQFTLLADVRKGRRPGRTRSSLRPPPPLPSSCCCRLCSRREPRLRRTARACDAGRLSARAASSRASGRAAPSSRGPAAASRSAPARSRWRALR